MTAPELKTLLDAYFPGLDDDRHARFYELCRLLREWNEKINLVSRKDIDALETHHLLHCLSIGRILPLLPRAKVVDVGTGGGLPGLALAVAFPETHFTLLDSRKKKLTVVDDVIEQLGLKNAETHWGRAEEYSGQFDFVTGRAVTDFRTFYGWARNLIHCRNRHELNNGVLYLKGGDFVPELKQLGVPFKLFPLQEMLPFPYFETKFLVYLKRCN